MRRDAPFPVESEVLAATPFVRLVRLRRPTGPQRRRIVLLAPHSGLRHRGGQPAAHRARWRWARSWSPTGSTPGWCPTGGRRLRAGRAGGDRHRGRGCLWHAPAHLVALSQSGPAALAAAAMLAASSPDARTGQPRLPRLPARAARGADRRCSRRWRHWPRDMLAASLTREVAPDHPGAGRRVYPALFQLLAYGMASPRPLRRGAAGPAARDRRRPGRRLRPPACRPAQPARRAGRAVRRHAGLGARPRRPGVATGWCSRAPSTSWTHCARCRC